MSDAFNAARVDVLGLPGEVVVFGDVRPEPDIPNLDALLALAREVRADLVVGFGGGSAMDLAKLAAVLPGSGQTIPRRRGPEKVNGRRVALVQVPTTSGTGSEAGTRALVTDPATPNKLAVQSRYMLADLAVVDPDLTLTVPAAVTAATGVDALAHCAEAYTSRKAHPLIDLYALEGIRLVGRFLARAVTDGSDREARAGLALASLYGGYCLGPVNTTAGHAVAYPLGTRHHIPHGLACALIFPHTLAFNAPAAPRARRPRSCEALGLPARNDPDGVRDAAYRLLRRSRHRDAVVAPRRARKGSGDHGRRGARHPPPARQQPPRDQPRRNFEDVRDGVLATRPRAGRLQTNNKQKQRKLR